MDASCRQQTPDVTAFHSKVHITLSYMFTESSPVCCPQMGLGKTVQVMALVRGKLSMPTNAVD